MTDMHTHDLLEELVRVTDIGGLHTTPFDGMNIEVYGPFGSGYLEALCSCPGDSNVPTRVADLCWTTSFGGAKVTLDITFNRVYIDVKDENGATIEAVKLRRDLFHRDLQTLVDYLIEAVRDLAVSESAQH